VTVVFADLVGYTALSEHLDPERVKRLIDGAFKRLIADINTFGGRVDKVLGDGILAMFGAPVAHEDDADRAIRAAMQMHESLAGFVGEQSDLAAPLQLRVGVNTGEVLVGTVSGTTDYTAMGDVVNVASRLQTMAPPGGIYIGDSTASLASIEIMRELVDDIEVRGREQSERVWRITGRQRRVPTIGVRPDIPFVGRSAQSELLTSIMAVVANGRSAVVSVSGEAGSGKTRLVNEALAVFPSRNVEIFAGVCAPFGETNVWAPIATPLFRRFGLDPTQPAELVRKQTRAKGAELYGFDDGDPVLDRFVEGIMHLLGQPSHLDDESPMQARGTLFALIVEGIRRRSRVGPVVLWLDDLQWADVLLIDLLHRLARSLADRPVLIITAQRDDADLNWPPAVDHPITVRMPLDPLARDEAEQLIEAVLGQGAETVLTDNIYERSGGNPLFLTELAELSRSNPASTALPGSLRALIAARLDRLAPGPRAALDNAAVLGASGMVMSLEIFASEMDQEFSGADLDVLTEDGLLEVEDGWWHFRTDVVREVAYETLTKLARAQRHAGTASAMAQEPVMPIDQIAHHAATAAELVADIGPVPGVVRNIDAQAARLLRDAAHRSLEVGAFHQAKSIATRALDLDPEDAELARELLLLRAEAETERRQSDRARSDAEDALEASILAQDRRHEGIARRLLGVLSQRDGDLLDARVELDASVKLFRELGDDIELASSLRERGFTEVFGGSLADAELLLGKAEALSELLDDRRGRAWVRQHQAWVAFLSGDSHLAEIRLHLAADEFEELGDRVGRGWAFGLLAYVRFNERRFIEAEEIAMRVRADALELGDQWAPAMMDSLIASIRLWTSRFAESEELSRRALVGFRELGDQFGVVQALSPRLRVLAALGRSHEAERGIEEVLSLGESFGDLAFPVMAAAGAAVHLGFGERAVVIGELALDRITKMGADGTESRTTYALGLCQVGRPEEALAVLLDNQMAAPYGLAVHAIAAAMTGDYTSPVDDASAVWEEPGSSYLDRVFADVAAAAALIRRGDGAEALEFIERARRTATHAHDVVAKAFVSCASATLIEDEPHGAIDHLGSGWHSVIEGLSGVDPHAHLATV
jgi:class 3 adenylate cyclase/tetratricopeptide (TPR) repeat protein